MTAGTADASPIKEKLALTAGLLTTAEIKFPAGCHGLVKVRIFKQGSQIIPLSTGEYVIGDDQVVTALVNQLIGAADATVEFQGSSPSATYSHVITVSFNVVSQDPTPQQAIQINADNDIVNLLYRICVALNVHDGFIPKSGIQLPTLTEQPYEPPIIIPPMQPPATDEAKIHNYFTGIPSQKSIDEQYKIVMEIWQFDPTFSILNEFEIATYLYWLKNVINAGLINLRDYPPILQAAEKRNADLHKP